MEGEKFSLRITLFANDTCNKSNFGTNNRLGYSCK